MWNEDLFNKEGFMDYVGETYHSTFADEFTWEWLDRTIDYCLETSFNTDEFVSTFTYMVPGITKDEILDYFEGTAICKKCGRKSNFDETGIWITSSYPICDECYNNLSSEELDKIRKEYE